MKQEPVSSFYDEKYSDYHHPAPETWLEKAFVTFQRYELHRNDAAAQLLTPAKSILDIGAGFGDLLLKANQRGFTKLYGIDISPVVIKHCQKNLKKQGLKSQLSVQNVDTKLSYKANFFDAVTIIAVLEHVFSPHHVLTEIHRVLKPGGQVVVEVPNVVFLPRRLSFLLGRLPKTSDEPLYRDGHLQFFTHQSLQSLLEAHGFMVVHQGCSGIAWRWRNWWPTLLGANLVVKAIKI